MTKMVADFKNSFFNLSENVYFIENRASISCHTPVKRNYSVFSAVSLKIFIKTMIAHILRVMSERHLITVLGTHHIVLRFRYPADDQLLICLLFQPDIIVVCTVSIILDTSDVTGRVRFQSFPRWRK